MGEQKKDLPAASQLSFYFRATYILIETDNHTNWLVRLKRVHVMWNKSIIQLELGWRSKF